MKKEREQRAATDFLKQKIPHPSGQVSQRLLAEGANVDPAADDKFLNFSPI